MKKFHSNSKKSAGCLVDGKIILTTLRKETLSNQENGPVVGIPMIALVGNVAIQPQATIVTVQFEHVRIAVGISFCALRHL